MEREEILKNKADREAATEILALILSEPRTDRFWECLKELIENILPKAAAQVPPLESELVAAIEKKTFPAGKHSFEMVRDVPTEYICWWVDQNKSSFNQQLADYVKTRHFREKQDKGL